MAQLKMPSRHKVLQLDLVDERHFWTIGLLECTAVPGVNMSSIILIPSGGDLAPGHLSDVLPVTMLCSCDPWLAMGAIAVQ